MKRFWKEVTAAHSDGAWQVALDGRPVRTPARAPLVLPTSALAEAVAEEWRSCGETIDPRSMPLTGLANAAIDRVAPDPEAFAKSLSQYAASDLFCYRAEFPVPLVEAQAELWDPLLTWSRRRFDIDFSVTTGVLPIDQPPATLTRLAHEVARLSPFPLAALAPLVTVGGSLVAALGLLEGHVSTNEAWEAVSLDERWQLQEWGSDAEAEKAMAARERDFRAGAKLLALLA